LAGNPLKCEGIEHLVNHEWKSLKKLHLRNILTKKVDTKIADEGAFHLGRIDFPALEELYLG